MNKIIILVLTLTAMAFCKYAKCDVNSTADTVFVYCTADDEYFGHDEHELKMSKDGSYLVWAAHWGEDDRETLDIYRENYGDISSLRVVIDKYGVKSRIKNFSHRRPTEIWNGAKSTLGF
jgi:hypothetical protein